MVDGLGRSGRSAALFVIVRVAQHVVLSVEFPDEHFYEPLDVEAIAEHLQFGRN